MTKERIFTFCLLLFFVPELVSAEVYSLNDLYKFALERSEVIKIAEEDLYISEREKDSALADLIPTLSAFGHHTRYSDAQMASGFLLQPDYTNEWGVRLDQSYSLGGKEFTDFGNARRGVEKSTYDANAVREGHLLNVAVQYYDVLKAKREIEIAEANVKRLTKERDAAKKRLEVGESVKTVLLRAEAELADAQSELIAEKNLFRISKNILAKTVGIAGGYDVKEPEPGIDYIIPEKDEVDLSFLTGECRMSIEDCLKQIALSERAEIQSLTIQKRIAEANIKSARSSYLPNFSLEGVYYRQENEPSRSFELDESIYGVLKLDFPFYEGGKKKAEVSRANARLRQAEHLLSDLVKQVKREVENSYIAATTAAAVIKSRKNEIKFAAENYTLVSKQFQFGLADSVDVIDANTRLVTSERELLNAQYVYVLSIVRLMREMGILLKTVVSGK